MVRTCRNLAHFQSSMGHEVDDARQLLRAHPRYIIACKTLRTACANLQEVIAAGVHAHFEKYLAETESLLANNDQRGSAST